MIKPWIRIIIFWSFITFFFITAPLSVLYTAGFRYNIQSGRIVRTGVISVSTTPRNVRISLNGDKINKTTPYVIKRLMPGEYSILLEKDKFHPWSGKVKVKSGDTTLIQSILLFKNSKPELIVSDQISDIAHGRSDNIAYLLKDNNWTEVWIHNLKNNNKQLISRIPSKELDKDILLEWSHNNGYLSIQDLDNDLIQVFDQFGNEIELNKLIIPETTKLFWHPSSDNLLYAATTEKLHQFDLMNGNETIFNDKDASTVILDASVITFKDNGNQVELRQSFNDENKLIALLPKSVYKIVQRDNEFLIIEDARGKITLINIHANEPILLDKQINSYNWLSDQDVLVYSDGIEINVYDAKSHRTDFITRQGDSIKDVVLLPSEYAIIYSTDQNIKAIERFNIAQQKQTTSLVEGADIDLFWLKESGETLYFFGSFEGQTGLFAKEVTR